MKLPHPIFVGETLWSESLVLKKRESSSRPHAGIVTIKTRTLNQHGDECSRASARSNIYKRGARPQPFPNAKKPLTAPDEHRSGGEQV